MKLPTSRLGTSLIVFIVVFSPMILLATFAAFIFYKISGIDDVKYFFQGEDDKAKVTPKADSEESDTTVVKNSSGVEHKVQVVKD